jgi:PIN domain nuclease of toxin-antitoxin system
LLDTHVLIYWLTEPGKLSREQDRAISQAVRRAEPLAVSAITLMEIAVIPGARLRLSAQEILDALEPGSDFQIVPLDLAIASEVAAMGDSLRDPADRVIVATARVHRLGLVTSDQRIIDSKLVSVVE